MSSEFLVEPLDRKHDRKSFTCGEDSLDAWLKTQAGQDMRRKANAVFVMVEAERPETIVGYFTLCATALSQGDVPDDARKLVPRYPLVSATLIGRLAIAASHHGRRLGSVLLASALRKAYENASIIGSSMVVVDAIDERAARFYAAHGFVRLPDSMRLILPLQSIERLM